MTVRDYNLIGGTRRYFIADSADEAEVGSAEQLAKILKAIRRYIKENDTNFVENLSFNLDDEVGWTAVVTH
jgi:hypothetical protein